MANNPRWLPAIVMIVAVIVVAAGLSGYLYFTRGPSANPTVPTVQVGDNVTVNYIGIMGSGPDQGKVFDTSIYAVAENNATYPKTLTFQMRSSAKNYTPLGVHVSGNTPNSGYTLGNLTFVGVVTGFWQGLVGMAANSTRTLVIPPALGYHSLNPSCMATEPLTYTMPVVQAMSLSAFSSRYPGQSPTQGVQFPDPHYGWPVLVLNANASFTTVENLPTVGWTSSPAGWPVQVTALTSTSNGTGLITLTNDLTTADAGHVLGHAITGGGLCNPPSGGHFIVWSVNPANGTYTENYNTEVTGETLIFIVTVTGLFTPGRVG
jgi:hypothetical protein